MEITSLGAESPMEDREMNEQIRQRIRKIEELKASGIHPYPNRFFPNALSQDLIHSFESSPESVEGKNYILAGRIHAKRVMGKASFAHLKDSQGLIQIYATHDDLGEENYKFFKSLDLGDQVGVEGYLFRTQKGEVTLHLKNIVLLAKCIRPLPIVKEKDGVVYDAFSDIEQRYRMRYVDLIVNEPVKKTFLMRSKIIQEIRRFFTDEGFLEVETPMMQLIPGGAAARPFITHHNALDIDLYLRIAPELYLKRLIVGGIDRVFELNRNFRNEGISTKHNPEFTMLEAYMAYGDMETMLKLTERLFTTVAARIGLESKFQYGKEWIDLSPPWKRRGYLEIIQEYSGIDFTKIESTQEAIQAARNVKVDSTGATSIWKVADDVFSSLVEPHLIQPIFITDFPKAQSPLAKSREDNPEIAERFEPYIAGREMGNAFSELNDPFEQRIRFEEQIRMRELGDEEAFMMDEDYIRALEYGMPPTGGLGIGIDRMVMLFTNSSSIRDTILFPLMKPE